MGRNMYGKSMLTSRIRQEQGFTLIEAMLSSAILAIGLLGLAGMTTLSFTRNRKMLIPRFLIKYEKLNYKTPTSRNSRII